MQIKVNDEGYITDFALVGTLVGGTEIDEPSDIEHFTTHFSAYRVRDGRLAFDEEQASANETAEATEQYRRLRESECFSVINRGQLWYDTLTEEQKEELGTWYHAWLDGTDTLTVPEKPTWLS